MALSKPYHGPFNMGEVMPRDEMDEVLKRLGLGGKVRTVDHFSLRWVVQMNSCHARSSSHVSRDCVVLGLLRELADAREELADVRSGTLKLLQEPGD